jgi:hypothetical protein
MITWFDTWRPHQCLAALLMLATAVLVSLATIPTLNPQRTLPMVAASASEVAQPDVPPEARQADATETMSDIKVYQRITAAVAAGESYYDVVAREHRLHNYPLKPFFTIRPPMLAWVTAGLGSTGSRLLMFLLIGVTALVWLNALRSLAPLPFVQYAAFGLIAESAFMLSLDPYVHFHESWAALLIALSIGVRRPDRFAMSIAAGLTAVLIRELALPFLILMAALAAYEQSKREAISWCGAVVVALVVQLFHANAVAAVVIDTDPASQGWSGLGGWSFFLTAVSNASMLELVPRWLTALILPLSLFGWIAWRSAIAVRVAGLLLGYTTLLVVFARPDNIYWALLIEPFLLAGLSFGAVGIWRLWQGSQLVLNSRRRPGLVTSSTGRQ